MPKVFVDRFLELSAEALISLDPSEFGNIHSMLHLVHASQARFDKLMTFAGLVVQAHSPNQTNYVLAGRVGSARARVMLTAQATRSQLRCFCELDGTGETFEPAWPIATPVNPEAFEAYEAFLDRNPTMTETSYPGVFCADGNTCFVYRRPFGAYSYPDVYPTAQEADLARSQNLGAEAPKDAPAVVQAEGRMERKTQTIYVISGPSGSGKTTLARALGVEEYRASAGLDVIRAATDGVSSSFAITGLLGECDNWGNATDITTDLGLPGWSVVYVRASLRPMIPKPKAPKPTAWVKLSPSTLPPYGVPVLVQVKWPKIPAEKLGNFGSSCTIIPELSRASMFVATLTGRRDAFGTIYPVRFQLMTVEAGVLPKRSSCLKQGKRLRVERVLRWRLLPDLPRSSS